MKEYKRLTKKENGRCGIDGKLVNQRQKALDVFEEAFNIAVKRLADLEDKIENGTLIEVDNKVYPPNKSIGVWGDYCSKCGGLIGENGYEENYCSHCGAKLKEQENER